MRKDPVVGFPHYNVISDQAFQRGGQRRIRDISHLPPEFPVAQYLLRRQDADDPGVPFPAEDLKSIFQRASDALLYFSLIHLLIPPLNTMQIPQYKLTLHPCVILRARYICRGYNYKVEAVSFQVTIIFHST